MSVRNLFRMVCLAVAVATTGQLQAGFINDAVGLAAPTSTITFSEVLLDAGTPVTNQFSSYGVTFTPALTYDTFYGPSGLFPSLTGVALTNFNILDFDGSLTDPFSIFFTSSQTQVAFNMVTDAGNATFSAFLGGSLVESASAETGLFGNFYGFTGITFDEIRISNIRDGAMVLDNMQFGVVPEPATMALFGIGAFGMGLVASRRRK